MENNPQQNPKTLIVTATNNKQYAIRLDEENQWIYDQELSAAEIKVYEAMKYIQPERLATMKKVETLKPFLTKYADQYWDKYYSLAMANKESNILRRMQQNNEIEDEIFKEVLKAALIY